MSAAQRPPRRLIVDGHNVLLRPSYPRPPRAKRESAQATFVGLLRTYVAGLSPGTPAWVVFDVRDPSGGMPPASRDAWVEVEFAAPADDRIVARLAVEGGSGATVVTSDAELARRVRLHGAEVESADAFLLRLFARPRPRRERPDPHGGKPAPPRGDTLLRDMAEQSAPREDDE